MIRASHSTVKTVSQLLILTLPKHLVVLAMQNCTTTTKLQRYVMCCAILLLSSRLGLHAWAFESRIVVCTHHCVSLQSSKQSISHFSTYHVWSMIDPTVTQYMPCLCDSIVLMSNRLVDSQLSNMMIMIGTFMCGSFTLMKLGKSHVWCRFCATRFRASRFSANGRHSRCGVEFKHKLHVFDLVNAFWTT